MEEMSILGMLEQDEDRVKRVLRAYADTREDRDRCLSGIQEEIGELMLRYNAACPDDPERQLVADSMAAVVRDELSLLLAGGAVKETSSRRVNAASTYLLIGAVVAGVCAALPLVEMQVVRFILMGVSVVFSFLSGRGWFTERQTDVRMTLDADRVWDTLTRTISTMDQKLKTFSEALQLSRSKQGGSQQGSSAISKDELVLFGDLLEALYTENGEYALRQLKKVRSYMQQRGIELVEYDRQNADMFTMLPTKKGSMTQRPALMAEGQLLLPGVALDDH